MPVPFASQGDKNTIPVTPSTETGQINYASYQKGFPPVTMTPLVAGGLPPQGMDMNGILYALSSSIGFSQSGGLPTFNADFASTIGGYPLGAVLQSNDGASAYVSTIENNTTDFNSSHESIGTSWLPWAGDAAKGSSLYIAVGEGTSDAITAAFDPAITELTNGLVVFVRALASNATTTPTFSPDGLTAATITKGTYQPLAVGDIAGNGYWMILQYDTTQGKWVLQNPAKSIGPTSGVPIGTVEYFAMSTPPAGYLRCDGAAVGRKTYPELFAAIGTTYGEGDGETTFNLPDLINRFAQGSAVPGKKIEAGLPNIEGTFSMKGAETYDVTGAFEREGDIGIGGGGAGSGSLYSFSASRSNPIYGNSDTVQPPALTLLPCIKAFDAATNPGLIDITELAQEMAGKVDKVVNGKNIAYVVDSYRDNDGTWYRRWSDNWIEQGGTATGTNSAVVNLLLPFVDDAYSITTQQVGEAAGSSLNTSVVSKANTSFTIFFGLSGVRDNSWYACGQGAEQ